ncbi:MAG: SDR family NAD(P)-dependent oxidoreductase [Dehalococcoidia bacterium]
MLEKLRLDGKVALVTGAGRGIGRALALALAGAGADVACAARTQAQIDAVAEEVRSRQRRAVAIVANVANPAQAAAMVEQALAQLGRLDILVNNAGGSQSPPAKTARDLTDDEWRLDLESNLSSVFYCSRAALAPMLSQGSGSIINIGSSIGVRGSGMAVGYGSAKGGVLLLTQTLAMMYARHNIKINCIVPGYVAASGARLAEPEELRQARGRYTPVGRIGYLASDAASYVTGAILIADGGCFAGGMAPVSWTPTEG